RTRAATSLPRRATAPSRRSVSAPSANGPRASRRTKQKPAPAPLRHAPPAPATPAAPQADVHSPRAAPHANSTLPTPARAPSAETPPALSPAQPPPPPPTAASPRFPPARI